MSNLNELNELIQYIKGDCEKLESELKKSNSLFTSQFPNIKSGNKILSIDEKFLNNQITKNLFKIPFSADVKIEPKLEKRLNLFKKCFLSELDGLNEFVISYFFNYNNPYRCENLRVTLYLLLFRKVFQSYLNSQDSIDDIIKNLLNSWNEYLRTKELHLQIIIPITNTLCNRTFELIEDVLWLKRNSYFLLSNKMEGCSVVVLKYSINTSSELYKTYEEWKKNKSLDYELHENKRLMINRNIQEILFTLYIKGLEFIYKHYIIEEPWWFQYDFKEYKKLLIGEESPGSGRGFNSNDCSEFRKLYPKLIESNLFRNNDYKVLQHHYLELHNRIWSPDVILDCFILLEFLFGSRKNQDLSFEFSFNAAFFLAESSDEFLNFFRLFKKSYWIRSKMMHGDNWYERLEKTIQEFQLNNHTSLFHLWKICINKSLEGLIGLKITNPDILKDINQFSQKKNRLKKVDYLNQLGNYFLGVPNLSEALKMFNKAYQIIIQEEEPEVLKYKEQISNSIEDIYGRNNKIIIYSDEIALIEEELHLNKSLNEKKIE